MPSSRSRRRGNRRPHSPHWSPPPTHSPASIRTSGSSPSARSAAWRPGVVPEARLPARADPAGAPAPPAHARPARRPGEDAERRSARPEAVLDEAKADVLVGFGGYVSTPAYVAAWRRKTPIVVHEGNAGPGDREQVRRPLLTRHVKTSFPGSELPHAEYVGHADPAGDLDAGPGRAAGRGPRSSSAWTRTRRPCSSPAGRRARGGSTRRSPAPAADLRRPDPGAARDRPEEHPRGAADRPLPVRRR